MFKTSFSRLCLVLTALALGLSFGCSNNTPLDGIALDAGHAGTGAAAVSGSSAGSAGTGSASSGTGGHGPGSAGTGSAGTGSAGTSSIADSGVKDASPEDSMCLADDMLDPNQPICDAYIPRWAFDPATSTCHMFIWDGCSKRKNNFPNQTTCAETCGAVVEPIDGGAAPDSGSIDPNAPACKVNGTVYPSGTGGIVDPVSCNTCSCDHGQLACTKIGCPKACPKDTAYGTSCAQCGPTDACQVVETGCLPSCSEAKVCPANGGGFCNQGVCRMVCG